MHSQSTSKVIVDIGTMSNSSVLKWHHLHDYFPRPPSDQQGCSLRPPPTTTQTTTTTQPPYQPNGWWATWPAQQTNGYNRQQATSPVQWTNNDDGQQATSPAQQTQWPQTVSHLASPMDEQQQRMASHPTSPTDEQQWWTVTKLVNGCATTSRWWQRMSSSLSVNLSEHHDSPPCLLYSHENQGATSPSATWQLTLGLLLLTTLPTPGLCPMLPLRASACRAAMGPFI